MTNMPDDNQHETKLQGGAGGAALVVSFDTELAWGRVHEVDLNRYMPLYEFVPGVVTRLLRLFEKYQAAATWAIVGALLEPEAAPSVDGPKSMFNGVRMVEEIRNSTVNHEIGCHSFTHRCFDLLSKNEAEEDLERCLESASRNGITHRSFVFPKNRIAHLDLLAAKGFRCYRGIDRTWYESFSPGLRRVCRQIDSFVPTRPRVSQACLEANGLVRIDGQLPFYLPSWGYKRRLPMSVLVKRAKKGMESACLQGAIFHLWLHPHNFTPRTEEQLAGMAEVLRYAATLRSRGALSIRTMAEAASTLNPGVES